jgi:phosphohistidine phosphatase SixA
MQALAPSRHEQVARRQGQRGGEVKRVETSQLVRSRQVARGLSQILTHLDHKERRLLAAECPQDGLAPGQAGSPAPGRMLGAGLITDS